MTTESNNNNNNNNNNIKLYLVRHAQSLANVGKRLHGHFEPSIGLSENGVREAEKLGKQLFNVEFDVVITSEFERAKQTARIILSQNSNVDKDSTVMVEDGAFNEMHLGSMEGGLIHEHRKSLMEIMKEWGCGKTNFKGALGESPDDVFTRFKDGLFALLARLRQENKAVRNVLLVSHALSNKMYLARSLFPTEFGPALERFPQDNSCVNILEICGESFIVLKSHAINDVSHL